MKRESLTFALVCAVGAFVYAGPEPIMSSGKEMKEVVPMATPCPSWTGFYVGGFAGYKFGNMDVDFDFDDTFEELSGGEFALLERGLSHDLDTSGAELGGLIGFNYQWHNWVFGAEAAGGYLWLRNSRSQEVVPPEFPGPITISESFKTHYLFTFGPRIGYTFCRWMPYVTGGLAVGDLEFDEHWHPVDSTDFFEGRRQSETNAGWFVGGGLEYALTNHWRLRGQYEYIDLGSINYHNTIFDEGTVDGLGLHHVELTEHNVSFAVIYGF